MVSRATNGDRDETITSCMVRRASARSLPRAPAFTLLEMALVLLIMSMVAAIAVPRYADFTVRQRLGAATRRLTTDFALGQRAARFGGKHQEIMFPPGVDGYSFPGLLDPDDPTEDYGVFLFHEPYLVILQKVDFAGATQVSFDPYGRPDNGGTIVLQAGHYQVTLTVDAQTGRISTSGVVGVAPKVIEPLAQ